MILRGRQQILSEYSQADLQDLNVIASVVNNAMNQHSGNRTDIEYLMSYKNGDQTILYKEKVIRDEVNNKLVLNHAQMITRMINGYFLGTPIQYIQSGNSEKQEEIDMLNRYVAYEDKASVDKDIGELQSICGTAYRIIYTDGIYGDEVPFEDKALNPATTFVVYENNIAEKPLLGVTFYDVLDEHNNIVGKMIYVYTETASYTFKTGISLRIDETTEILDITPYNIGGVPIIEYPNNMWRLGDWELCIGLMDAINSLQSGRLDDIDQIIQSLVVFVNADIDPDVYDEMRLKGVVMLKNPSGQPVSVDTVTNQLDQSGMHTFSEELESLLYALIGIPDRNNRSGSGGDTGAAVELRDGWADMEIVARNKESVFKKSEKQTLRIILNILKNTKASTLSLIDVDIKFSRNKSNNLLVKTQGYMNLLQTKTLSPADCLTIVDLVSDVNEYIARGEKFWGESFAGKVQAELGVENSKTVLDNLKNPTPEANADAKVEMNKVDPKQGSQNKPMDNKTKPTKEET